ncbi:hypothetical protein P261_02000 [Lachnospiraceae bacterium TWA4]|nr:hypothetical protein P261_02000 [Lachnospiraceae bacterium TWA4]
MPSLENDEWIYNVETTPKYGQETQPSKTTKIRVHKSWNDNNNKNRPSSVEVELLKDGTIHDTVTLNEKILGVILGAI